MKGESPHIQSLLDQSKYYLRCMNAKKAIQLAEKAVLLTSNMKTPESFIYKCYDQLITAYFYAGQTQKGFTLLKSLAKSFGTH